MDWRRATADDAVLVAELASRTSDTELSAEQALAFLNSWYVEIADQGLATEAAVAVLPPAKGRSRGYGAWWTRHDSDSDRFGTIGGRLVQLAESTPGLSVLQISVPAERPIDADQLRDLRFERAYPLWTMVHDNATWPNRQLDLPPPLRFGRWVDVASDEFQAAYEHAYRDQRLVEPQTPETWDLLVGSDSFATDLATMAIAPDGQVAGFVLGFHHSGGGIELGPIGTLPSWRGRGVCSALLATVLMRCRDSRSHPIGLTVDGESPTRAQQLYLRHGFQVTRRLVAYQVQPSARIT
ncbi:acetyltransferase (GNAT) family protein [Kribbella sp. VKM Ac-2569]|uniref:GNAT family N-acetyltransferase n=1 Tax=Kribbella sp. VKM Ac-2569 TaxID=2512220 RepID=UPI00102B7BCE|nr:GNAT family N-acetyltransferase [Kribbella sp. VKM Ac-2569]RZT11875.1 acetyltransferase (GNAT) family protein [Kribbella sp. VKM Ac-2569]